MNDSPPSHMPPLHKQPAWFGSVMGTAAVALLFNLEGSILDAPFLTGIAIALLWIASALAILLWPRYLRRLAQRDELHAEVSDPGHGAMLATLPAGLLVLAIGWGSIGPETLPETVALWIAGILVTMGAVITVVFSAYWVSVISRREVPLERINGGWLIPVVMPLIIPVALVPLIDYSPEFAKPLLFIGFLFLGIGAILFIAIFSMLVIRLATKPPLPNPMTPSLWIPLAPAGVFGVAVMRLAQAAAENGLIGPDSINLAVGIAAMGIGFGLWWALFAFIELRRVRKSGGLPFHIGWWGFVFPIAGLALAIVIASEILEFTPLIGLIASAIAVIVWLYVAIRTFRAVFAHWRATSPGLNQ